MKIKVMWVTAMILPIMRRQMGMTTSYGGGWLDEPANLLANDEEIDLTVISTWSGKEVIKKEFDGYRYYLIPVKYLDRFKNPGKKFRTYCKKILEEVKPDVIHVHGSEFAEALGIIENSDVPKVLSIQGLISKINSDYFYGGIKMPSWFGAIMPWNLKTYFPMKLQHARNNWRAKSEKRQLRQVDAIIGSTRWDYTYSKLINPNLGYYKIGYAIRREFSEYKWELENCTRHNILISSMAVPLKGLHRALEAFALLKKKYKDAKLTVVGTNTFNSKPLIGYPNYLYKKAKKLDVLDDLRLIGPQDAVGMANAFLDAHTFVLSSCIENGPNSLMEAMYIGTPSVCSYVGGAMELAKEGEEAMFYRFEEPEILAYEIDKIWSDDEIAKNLSKNARARAKTFDSYNEVYLQFKNTYKDLIREKV